MMKVAVKNTAVMTAMETMILLKVAMGMETIMLLKVAMVMEAMICLLYTSPSPRDSGISRMPSSA